MKAAAAARPARSPGASEFPDRSYSVARYRPPRSGPDEEVNVGIILADIAAGAMYRRFLSAGEAARRSAECLPARAVADAAKSIGAAMSMDDSRGRGGGAAGRLCRLSAMCGRLAAGGTRVTRPRALSLPLHDHDGAAAWCYNTMVSRGRRAASVAASASASTAPGRYTFAAIQHVPDAARNEPVNVGVAVADSLSQSTIVRYASGTDLDCLGGGRFDGLDVFHSYEGETKVGDNAGPYLRGLAQTSVSCVRFTPPRAAPGDDPKRTLGELYKRLAAPAPHHVGSAP